MRHFPRIPFTGDIATNRCQSAAGIFNEGSHDHVRTHIGGFHRLHEFSVAVIHHADHIRLDAFDKGDQLTDPLYGQGRSGLISLGSLDGYQMCLLINVFTDLIIVKAFRPAAGLPGDKLHRILQETLWKDGYR